MDEGQEWGVSPVVCSYHSALWFDSGLCKLVCNLDKATRICPVVGERYQKAFFPQWTILSPHNMAVEYVASHTFHPPLQPFVYSKSNQDFGKVD